MEEFNDIGINRQLDWNRIEKLLRIGLFSSLIAIAGDFLLGYGTADESLTGLERMLSAYLTLSDGRIIASALCGFLGINLTALSYFGVYRLMAERAPKYAHLYRTGIFGQMMVAGCGNHMLMLACAYFYKHLMKITGSFDESIAIITRFSCWFLLPMVVLEIVFFYLQFIIQFLAFYKEKTPYPKWCAVLTPIFFMYIIKVIAMFFDHPLANAIGAAWMTIGHALTFAGLLVMMKRAANRE